MAEKKFTEVINEINKITENLKNPNVSIEDALVDFKNAKSLIEEAEKQLTQIEEEVNVVLEDNKSIKKVDIK